MPQQPIVKTLGHYNHRKVHYSNLRGIDWQLPLQKGAAVLVIAHRAPESNEFQHLIYQCLGVGVSTVVVQGAFGKFLHDEADNNIVAYQLEHNSSKWMLTVGDNQTNLASSLWEILVLNPDDSGATNASGGIYCVTFDETDYSNKLKEWLARINRGWLPPDGEQAEVKADDSIQLNLSQAEAIVLSVFLERINGNDSLDIYDDPAEQRVLYDLECMLEKVVPGQFSASFWDLVLEARAVVRDELD